MRELKKTFKKRESFRKPSDTGPKLVIFHYDFINNLFSQYPVSVKVSDKGNYVTDTLRVFKKATLGQYFFDVMDDEAYMLSSEPTVTDRVKFLHLVVRELQRHLDYYAYVQDNDE